MKPVLDLVYHVLLLFQFVLVVVSLSFDALPSFPLASHHDDSTASSSSSQSSSPTQHCTITMPPRKVVHHRSPLLSSLSSRNKDPRIALIILNAPLSNNCYHSSPSPLFLKLWDLAKIRICADGGANRLYALQTATKTATTTSSTTENKNNRSNKKNELIPDMICGDLDSLLPHVRDHYANLGVAIQGDPDDQDTNDLDKSLTAAIRHHSAKCRRFAIYGAFGGRFDQEMASMQALYKWNRYVVGDDNAAAADTEPVSLWLYDDHTMACLLHANCENRIQLKLPPPLEQQESPSLFATTSKEGQTGAVNHDESIVIGEGPTCGLIPLGEPCSSCTTTGFQWNLSSQSMQFGGLVSTSNRIILQPKDDDDDDDNDDGSDPTNNVVTVVASSPLIFTAEIHCGRKNEWSSSSVQE